MAWCKERALDYIVRGEASNAIASMLSDLAKHPETSVAAGLGMYIAPYGGTAEDAKKWNEGFN